MLADYFKNSNISFKKGINRGVFNRSLHCNVSTQKYVPQRWGIDTTFIITCPVYVVVVSRTLLLKDICSAIQNWRKEYRLFHHSVSKWSIDIVKYHTTPMAQVEFVDVDLNFFYSYCLSRKKIGFALGTTVNCLIHNTCYSANICLWKAGCKILACA